MRWLFVGEALVLGKARRILLFLVLKSTQAVLRRSRSFIIHHSSLGTALHAVISHVFHGFYG